MRGAGGAGCHPRSPGTRSCGKAPGAPQAASVSGSARSPSAQRRFSAAAARALPPARCPDRGARGGATPAAPAARPPAERGAPPAALPPLHAGSSARTLSSRLTGGEPGPSASAYPLPGQKTAMPAEQPPRRDAVALHRTGEQGKSAATTALVPRRRSAAGPRQGRDGTGRDGRGRAAAFSLRGGGRERALPGDTGECPCPCPCPCAPPASRGRFLAPAPHAHPSQPAAPEPREPSSRCRPLGYFGTPL